MDWSSYNRSLVKRVEILFSYDFLDGWGHEIERMNKNKKDKPFIFPESFVFVIGYIRTSFHLLYKQTEGIIIASFPILFNYSTRRIAKKDLVPSIF